MTTRKKPNKPAGIPAIVHFHKDDSHQPVYSNVAQVLHTAYDFQFTFGQVDGSSNPSKIKAVATVMVSPQHAKQLANVLNKNVEKYESTNGIIATKLEGKTEYEGEFNIDFSDKKPS